MSILTKEAKKARDERVRGRQRLLDNMTDSERAHFAETEAQRLEREIAAMIEQFGLTPRTPEQSAGIAWSEEDRARLGV